MDFYIIIPAHNEEAFIKKTLDSLTKQTLLPKQVVVVNDHSTDNTQQLVEEFTLKYSWISLINTRSSDKHLPGSKIINAFYKGYNTLNEDFDVICKFDADLIFPKNYYKISSRQPFQGLKPACVKGTYFSYNSILFYWVAPTYLKG